MERHALSFCKFKLLESFKQDKAKSTGHFSLIQLVAGNCGLMKSSKIISRPSIIGIDYLDKSIPLKKLLPLASVQSPEDKLTAKVS